MKKKLLMIFFLLNGFLMTNIGYSFKTYQFWIELLMCCVLWLAIGVEEKDCCQKDRIKSVIAWMELPKFEGVE